MIHVARQGDVERELKLQAFREQTRQAEIDAWGELSELAKRPLLPYSARKGPGAASPVVCLASLAAPVVKNTYLGPATNLDGATNGSFPLDYFNRTGATFEIEAMGILSTTVTPTIVFRITFGTSFAAMTTMLCQHGAITTVTGAANLDWFLRVFGVVKASGTTSTMLVTGFLLQQFATAAAGNNLTFLKNATPPTAVTTDLETGGIFFDLQTTWSASSVSNQITTNEYTLKSAAA